ncbi:MAG: YfcC family protein [Anaerolineae bacterium]|nr:YfcC family protein [Anaerolineae bacterium]
MDQKSGAQIGRKAFIQSSIILAVLMFTAGVLTLIIPAGQYARIEQGGRKIVDPESFVYADLPHYPIWRWITAPIEVLWGSDGPVIAIIIVFLLMVGAAVAVLDQSGILYAVVGWVVKRFGQRKYALLLIISFLFMCVGAFLGIFEEVVPLVPLMVALAHLMGWDVLVGVGMSVLAANMGFSAAVLNPFSIGVAQKIAGLPLFSGAWLRILFFVLVYGVFALFMTRYAKSIEQDRVPLPGSGVNVDALTEERPLPRRAVIWFGIFMGLIVLVLVSGPALPALSDFALPLVGLLFLIGGVGAGMLAGMRGRALWSALGQGASGIAPGIPLILMAASVKHIVASGGIMDTLLHAASTAFAGASPLVAALFVYVLALAIEFFVGSASAKAFLIMPILLPLADLVGVTRQVTVTAYCFGDGFSNLAYPTNPVLLIVLGLTGISYGRWFKWTWKLWAAVVVLSVAFLWLASAINYGPF